MTGISLNQVLASECCAPSCEATAAEDAPFPLCMRHMRQVFAYFDGFAQLAKEVVAARMPVDGAEIATKVREAHETAAPRAREADGGQVYYVRTGDFIKIGYSVRVKQRMVAMRIDPSQVLATEPGPPELERFRHRQFAHLRQGRKEDFAEAPELLDHVAMLVEHYGPPRITTYGDTPTP